MQQTNTASDIELARAFAVQAAQLLADRRCADIRLLDVRGVSQVCDFMLIASGTSERQMRAVAHELADESQERGYRVFRNTADDSNTWIVVDFVDVVVHLFEPDLRLYYDLETLWGEGEALDWRRDDQKQAHRHRGEIGLAFNGDDDDDQAAI